MTDAVWFRGVARTTGQVWWSGRMADSFGSDQRLPRRSDARPAHAGCHLAEACCSLEGSIQTPEPSLSVPATPRSPTSPVPLGSHLEGGPAPLLRLPHHLRHLPYFLKHLACLVVIYLPLIAWAPPEGGLRVSGPSGRRPQRRLVSGHPDS